MDDLVAPGPSIADITDIVGVRAIAHAEEEVRPTVLQVLGPSTGGIRRHVAELSRQIESLRWRTVIAGPDAVMAGIGPQHVALSTTPRWSPRVLVAVRRRLRQHVRSADVVHAHGIKAAIVLSSMRRHSPLVVTLHNDMVGTYTGTSARLRRLLQAVVLRRADHVIFVSNASADRHRALVAAGRASVIMSLSATPAVTVSRSETRAKFGIGDDVPLVAVVARLHPQKGLIMFLEAFARLRAAVPAARAVVAGDGPQRAELEALRDSLGLGGAVDFVGATDGVADLVAAVDVLAISSRWEAGPISAVEAMQLGTPVVMTDTGAVAEVAARSAAVVATPIGDADAFATALASLLDEPERRRELGARGRALAAEEFDPTVLVHRIDAVYRRLHARPRTRRRMPVGSRPSVSPAHSARRGVRS